MAWSCCRVQAGASYPRLSDWEMPVSLELVPTRVENIVLFDVNGRRVEGLILEERIKKHDLISALQRNSLQSQINHMTDNHAFERSVHPARVVVDCGGCGGQQHRLPYNPFLVSCIYGVTLSIRGILTFTIR